MSKKKGALTIVPNWFQDDYAAFNKINSLLLNTPTPLKNVPIRVYIPSSPKDSSDAAPASFKVIQRLVPPRLPNSKLLCPFAFWQRPEGWYLSIREFDDKSFLTPGNKTQGAPQTLGAALKSILPSLFPSSRDPVLANVLLHGGPVPFRAPLEELMREAAYPDGWLCFCVVLL